MRIALTGPAHPDQGGAARHTTELAYRLTAAGHNVIVESWRAERSVYWSAYLHALGATPA